MNLRWHSMVSVTLCTLLLAEPVWSQSPPASLQEQVSRMPVDSNIEVKLRDGKKQHGNLVSAGEMAFELRPYGRSFRRTPAVVSISYNDVQSVRRHKFSPTELSMLVGVVTVVGVVIAIAVVLSKYRGV